MRANFLLGTLKIAPDARRALRRLPYDLLARHAVGDWGSIDDKQTNLNEHGLNTLGAIVSRYQVDPTDKKTQFVRIVTEATWRETVVTLEK